MPDDYRPDSLTAAFPNRSKAGGSDPEPLRRRYYTDERGGTGVSFYRNARDQTPVFRDQGHQLVTDRFDPDVIRDMAAIARRRGWTIVTVRGSAEFRREAWLAARSIGLEVQGYRTTARDLQALQQRLDRATQADDRRRAESEPGEKRRDRTAGEGEIGQVRRVDTAALDPLRVVDTVVRNRVADSERQERIMAAARQRVANWLERGARFDSRRAGPGNPSKDVGKRRIDRWPSLDLTDPRRDVRRKSRDR